VILPPPEADAREVAARLRDGEGQPLLGGALTDLVEPLDAVDRLARHADGPLPADAAGFALDIVIRSSTPLQGRSAREAAAMFAATAQYAREVIHAFNATRVRGAGPKMERGLTP
jgi:hypothetical protein